MKINQRFIFGAYENNPVHKRAQHGFIGLTSVHSKAMIAKMDVRVHAG